MAQQPPPYAPAPGEKQGLYPQVPPDPQQQQPLQPQPGGYYPQQQPPVDPTAPPGQQAVTYYPPAGGQQHPQQLVIPQPAPVIVTQPRGYRPYVCHIIFSCCVFWCTGWGCCCGLIAFILAMIAGSKSDASARSLGIASLVLSGIGLVVGVIGIIITFALGGFAVFTTQFGASCVYKVDGDCYSRRSGSISDDYCTGHYSNGFCYYH